jgi:hypothetical protein
LSTTSAGAGGVDLVSRRLSEQWFDVGDVVGDLLPLGRFLVERIVG